MPHAIILGTGRAVPSRVVTNDDLSKVMDTTDEWIRQRTGIEERHWISEGETGIQLGLEASRQAIAMAGLTPQDLDAIVYANITPDYFIPGNGVFVARGLGTGTIPAIDIRMQCAGFVFALSIADAWIRAGMYRRILVVGQEVQSTRMEVNSNGRNSAVIFADGAGAAVLGATDDANRGLLGFDLHSEGDYAEKLWAEGPGAVAYPANAMATLAEGFSTGKYFLQMDGREVFRHAVTRMPESVRTVLGANGLATSDIALLLPHQANLRISEMVQKELSLRDDQVYNNIQRYGNTTAATIPIMLDEVNRAGRLRPGDLVVMTAFGSGFVWGSCVLRW